MDPETRFAALYGVRISGSAAQTVVLANGFGTDNTIWAKILPWLEERYRVVRFNWLTDPIHYNASRYRDLAAYGDDLISIVGRTRSAPAILIGHSMAAMAGMLAGKRKPRLFSRMVMIAPSPCYLNLPGYHGGMEEVALRDLLDRIAGDYAGWVLNFAPPTVGKPAISPEVEEFARGLRALRPNVAFSMLMTILGCDLRDQLDGFAVPTVIIQPTRDPGVPLEVTEYLARRWSQARIHRIEAEGHLPHLTHAEAVIHVLSRSL